MFNQFGKNAALALVVFVCTSVLSGFANANTYEEVFSDIAIEADAAASGYSCSSKCFIQYYNYIYWDGKKWAKVKNASSTAKYTIYYDGSVYESKEFGSMGKCKAARDADYRCR